MTAQTPAEAGNHREPTVMPDLVERLREQSEWYSDGHGPLHKEAADEIARLRAEREKMGEGLRAIEQRCNETVPGSGDRETVHAVHKIAVSLLSQVSP